LQETKGDGRWPFHNGSGGFREGFQSTFRIASLIELFEPPSCCGMNAALAICLHETPEFSQLQTGGLIGFFGGLVWFLPIIGGTIAAAIRVAGF
jgi:dipeptide/tripeptide permease